MTHKHDYNGGFSLIIVLFILLVIIGCACLHF
ncbi:YjcZ family sporulation protein [Priestia flexa]|uniref:YjcZ family sporulation protein n=1 Tax=Priestia flexa TaxID=86664 RepID=A0A8I1MDG5_9BACI|nr:MULTISPECIES: YjcZ family sporulation protein [Bacillaceae]OZT13349.1 sporulation protein YjcZ [Priestia aryabhattai]USY54349.1 YjcZ family sporulation protein [Bacillus sp. 1780r2a1]MBN8250274.1 YjcZ family sporulation protein [Priestia flexa]MBN8432904.1 YjcZ family sporulation protein [Priestia flexa]MBY6084987.1 YjcZ family sporulation protein [Priestia flexa]